MRPCQYVARARGRFTLLGAAPFKSLRVTDSRIAHTWYIGVRGVEAVTSGEVVFAMDL